MPLRVLVVLFLVFMERSTPDLCVFRDHITALEGEPYYLKCCLSTDHHHYRNHTVRWSKRYGPNRTVPLSSSGRIIFNDDAIEFWPIKMIDEGMYTCTVGRKENQWNITVTKRSEHGCFHPKYLMTKEVEVGKSLSINCTHDYYQTEAYQISLFKDCSPIPGNHKPYIRKNAVLNDAGNYTCIFFLYKNRRSFNVTKTFNVKIKDNMDIMPALYGNNINYVEAELGKEKTLNCTALLRDPTGIIYWNEEHDNDTNIYKEKLISSGSNGKLYVSSLLKIKLVKEENLNVWYNCTLASAGVLETIGFFLKKKEGAADVSRHIFIIVLVSSAAFIFLVIMCVIYRVDILLCYRDLIRRDETLTDGKEYDAFVSYLKDCQPDNGDEHKFALEILPGALEKHFGYKLCIFERDIIPGGAIVDDIHSLIKKSRRLIIVLSENYMCDKVRYELESGLHEALVERKIKIILIEFTPISDFTFLPQSLQLLKSHRILKWKANKSLPYNSRFWKNLRYLMPAKIAK
ncbi:interleukin-18 receptor 1 [Phascolarctos cinereus]|uniref:Interleukin-18 receptor 1 n=1 Tax=Phascolarctos cinereus TaxID=38626 RepID=A0A6P5KGE3_PHACI|nr:interleukin-18 receptor 1 [Phascolarctos cinereus]XP_020843545.1 interleukin-18 receptor 1 [Phascolarctos cinereus]XP_020843546.1 interleukin-18 receptor 1 [Phascolarctos cinereus]XP_020843547.1 interleukin-18 receptor 1 [Phascolarctos cinereus]XP_020843548.1 interleukin-18 receptor 1 [Phascolarctos cinereus]